MKKIVVVLLLACVYQMASAQMMKVWKAEEQMNDGEIMAARTTITPALEALEASEKAKTADLAYAFNLAGNIESRLMQPEIEKAARKEVLDTALFVESLTKAVEYFEKSDAYDMTPDKKGKVKAEYHENNKKMVGQMMEYFAYVGQFCNQNGDREGSFRAFKKYIEMPKSPVFNEHESDSLYQKNEEMYNRIGYFAAMLAYELKDYDAVLDLAHYAIADSASRSDGYLMKLQAHLQKKDTAAWVATSREAIAQVDDNPSFCQNLLYYYNLHGDKEAARELGDELVKVAPGNKIAWYARGCVRMDTFHEYAAAREDFDKAIELDEYFMEALLNKGVSYVNELISLDLNTDTRSAEYKQTLETAHSYYKQALPLFEKVQALVPDRPNLWANQLRNIYYNLEMNDKAKEMEAVVDAMGN